MEQHYRMTLQDAIERYHAGDITIKGLIHFYILIKCKPGWKIKIDFESISQVLPVKKSTFYHVISCLKKEGAIAWEAVKGIIVSRITLQDDSLPTESDFPLPEPDSRILDSESRILDSESRILDSESRILDSESRILDYEAPKPAIENNSSDSPSSDQTLEQLLPNSLSEEQRENFIEFGKKKAQKLPDPPGLPLTWIRKNFDEIFEQWQKQSGAVTNQANNKWENHPKKEEWLEKIRTLQGTAIFVFENGFLDEERRAFVNWVSDAKIIWWE